MPDTSFLLLLLIIIVALGFGLANGFNDAANSIATVIGTRVLSPRKAILMAAFFEFAGAATGTAVAKTIAKGIVSPEVITQWMIIAALASATIWAVFATISGLPISVSHSLIAGMVGAGIATAGSGAIVWNVLQRVLSAVVCAPFLGFAGGLVIMIALFWVFRSSAPATLTGIFSNLQIASSAFMAYSHGKNDGQMPIGIITMALMVYYGWGGEFHIPFWVIALSAASISLGTAVGGWRVIRTVGFNITALRPVHGFAAQGAAAAVIETASSLGIPVSTTHCISSAVMGVGTTKRLSAVRWGVAREIVMAWILTFPICAVLGWLLARLAGLIF